MTICFGGPLHNRPSPAGVSDEDNEFGWAYTKRSEFGPVTQGRLTYVRFRVTFRRRVVEAFILQGMPKDLAASAAMKWLENNP